MTPESRSYHEGHEDERSRARALAKHVQEIENTRARYRRNLDALLSNAEPEETDWPGCTT